MRTDCKKGVTKIQNLNFPALKPQHEDLGLAFSAIRIILSMNWKETETTRTHRRRT